MSKIEPVILFYGPLGGGKLNIIGGGESGNRKTIKVLESLGASIEVCEKPYPTSGSIIYLLQMIWLIFRFSYSCLRFRKCKSVHISGFYNHLIYVEAILVAIGRFFGKNVIYEFRAGGFLTSLECRSSVYRSFVKFVVKKSTAVLSQGQEYISTIKGFGNENVYYYPNFVLERDLFDYNLNTRADKKEVKLVYFGRIAPSKNVSLILDICLELFKVNVNFSLDLIGKGDESYVNKLREIVSDKKLEKNVRFVGALDAQTLMKRLAHMHFFIFPSTEAREGHSNSLTEAMSLGVVPITSDCGFNRTVVGEDFLIIDTLIPSHYALRIKEIIVDKSEWEIYSKRMYDRVLSHYTDNVVRSVLKEAHNISV